MKRRPVPKKRKNGRPEPNAGRNVRDISDKKSKKYGAIFATLEEETEEIGEEPEF